MTTPDDSSAIAHVNCRGMLGCSLDEDGKICIEHQETDKHLMIAREDLDEVIDTLIEFREAMQAGKIDNL